MKKRIVLAGGSGFLGQNLAGYFAAAGWEVHILSRQKPAAAPYKYWVWDGRTLGEWAQALDGADLVVNLTGKSVNCRYNEANRREILESRMDSVAVLGQAVRQAKQGPKLWVQCGSLVYFGDAGDTVRGEASDAGTGFSAGICKAWEQKFDAEVVPGVRKVYLRIGFVLAPGGGAMGTLEKLVKYFMGSAVGSGKQFISWIHIEDFNRIVMHAVEHEEAQGIYNVTGLSPVTNGEFMAKLRKALRRPWMPPVPAPFAMIGAMLMGTESELALTGRRCLPLRLVNEGFEFEHIDLRLAFENLYGKRV